MTALYIVAGIVLVISALLFLNVNLIFSYDEKAKVKLRVLFITLDILKIFTAEKKPEKKKSSHAQAHKKQKPKGTFDDFMSFLELIISCIRMFTDNLSRSLKVHLKRLNVIIASDSADRTAVMYGAVSSTTAILLELLPNTVRKFKNDYENISIYPDYLSEKCVFSAEIIFTMKVWHFIRIFFGALRVFNENTRKRISERNRTKS